MGRTATAFFCGGPAHPLRLSDLRVAPSTAALRRPCELRQLHRRFRSRRLVLVVLEERVRVLPRLAPDPLEPTLEGFLAVIRPAKPQVSPRCGGHQRGTGA